MKKQLKLTLLSCLLTVPAVIQAGPKDDIYHKDWIDFNKNGKMDIYEDPSAPIEARVKDLLSQMNMDEKTCQMATLYGSGRVLADALPTDKWKSEIWKDGIGNIDEEHNGLGKFGSEYAFPYTKHVKAKHDIQRWFVEETRLGIPVDFTNEGIRGVCHEKATFFPAQCGQGSTWNKALIARIGEVEAIEATALGYTNIYSPILDVAQDPRWGRAVECYGEDPYLVGQLGKQMIESLQKHKLVATPKHFAVYSIPVGGRDGGTRTDPHVAPREMHTLYLEPFRVAFQEAGALGVMSSYNDYDGEPITGSYRFLTEILRHEWGFKGYVVSDSDAVEFISGKHNVAENNEEAVVQSVNAGLNVRTNFSSPAGFIKPLRSAFAKGKVSQATISDWCNGKKAPRFDKIEQLANFFNVPATYFFNNVIDEDDYKHIKNSRLYEIEHYIDSKNNKSKTNNLDTFFSKKTIDLFKSIGIDAMDLSDEELNEVKNFVEFVKNKRK